MADVFDELREELARERRRSRSESCLPDETLQAIADRSAPALVIERARRHFAECLSCLQTYAMFRSLVEASSATQSASGPAVSEIPRADWRKRVWDRIRYYLACPIPVGWSIATTVAALLLTWMLLEHFPRGGDLFSPHAPYLTGDSDRLTELAHKEADRPVTVTGTVESVRPANTEGIDTYVVTMRTRAGVEYLIVAWGRPTVRVGQTIEADGVFRNISDSGSPARFQGVASQLRSTTSK
jgi:hypothetical protein